MDVFTNITYERLYQTLMSNEYQTLLPIHFHNSTSYTLRRKENYRYAAVGIVFRSDQSSLFIFSDDLLFRSIFFIFFNQLSNSFC